MIDLFKNAYPSAEIYQQSVIEKEGTLFFMIRNESETFLVIGSKENRSDYFSFRGKRVEVEGCFFLKCDLSAHNADCLRSLFSFTKPVPAGKRNSYGLGDRLGNAGAAHLKAIRETGFFPVLAQQSIRELERTGRTAEEVLDAASWAVYREGYKSGFGADGDHLKTTEDIDLMMNAGFTMFTIDPSEYVVNEAINMSHKELMHHFENLPWNLLHDQPEKFLERVGRVDVLLHDGFKLSPSLNEILTGMVKYGRVITHTKMLADYIKQKWPDYPAEMELSVDETDQPTTLTEHYLIASELAGLGVDLVSLAPRFCGDFEKGVDFRGDLDQFRHEYLQHLAIAGMFGGYKLSIHSGSDKFSVYEVIGSINAGAVHVKTAGTSYLEALRTVAEVNPELFLQILEFSKKRFDEDKKTYHISGRPENIPDLSSMNGDDLKNLLNQDDARQVLHVAYGSVLHGQGEISKKFKKEIMNTLELHQDLYESNLVKHFRRHLRPFG
ncbi:MAG: hypothetical protein JJU37_06250 [Balneolaceae bacterium]|nr:hypothetical protein [Balneolaceae bacterium]